MKLRMIAIVGGVLLAGSLSAQTLTDVINEFNDGVAKVNNQEYDASLVNFNQVLTLAETVGDSASEMKASAEKLIPVSNYKQALLFLKRKQYDNAIPYLENTIETAATFNNNEEISAKANKYLLRSYMVEGQRNYKNKSFDEALAYYDKALAINGNLYQAHQGKGMVYRELDEIDPMMEEFSLAREGAMKKDDAKTIASVNGIIDTYYNKMIQEEMEMIDPEEADYGYVVEACENALAANPENPRALYHMALISNKKIEFDPAIEYAKKAIQFETEPVWMSAIYLELGHAYQNTVEYDKACEALQKVVEEPFLSKAEKKIESVGCN